MKKFFLILFICLFSQKVLVEPLYRQAVTGVNLNAGIITSQDPTTFQELVYIGEEMRNMAFYPIVTGKKTAKGTGIRAGKRKDIKVRPYVFHAFYENEIAIEILIYYKKKQLYEFNHVETLALKYAKMMGRMPHVLVQPLDAAHFIEDIECWAGFASASVRVVVMCPLFLKKYRLQNNIEEILIHELVHASLEKPHPGSYRALNKRISKRNKKTKKLNWSDWDKARKKDKEFISGFAKNSFRCGIKPCEDLPESFLAWLAFRYNKVHEVDREKILKTIPNRIKYLDDQNFNMYPVKKAEKCIGCYPN